MAGEAAQKSGMVSVYFRKGREYIYDEILAFVAEVEASGASLGRVSVNSAIGHICKTWADARIAARSEKGAEKAAAKKGAK